MTAKIVDLGEIRAVRKKADAPVEFALIGYVDGWLLEGRGKPWSADELLSIADDLRVIARDFSDRARELRGQEQSQILADVQLYESGLIRAWSSSRIETEEQARWALKQLRKAAIRPKGEA